MTSLLHLVDERERGGELRYSVNCRSDGLKPVIPFLFSFLFSLESGGEGKIAVREKISRSFFFICFVYLFIYNKARCGFVLCVCLGVFFYWLQTVKGKIATL